MSKRSNVPYSRFNVIKPAKATDFWAVAYEEKYCFRQLFDSQKDPQSHITFELAAHCRDDFCVFQDTSNNEVLYAKSTLWALLMEILVRTIGLTPFVNIVKSHYVRRIDEWTMNSNISVNDESSPIKRWYSSIKTIKVITADSSTFCCTFFLCARDADVEFIAVHDDNCVVDLSFIEEAAKLHDKRYNSLGPDEGYGVLQRTYQVGRLKLGNETLESDIEDLTYLGDEEEEVEVEEVEDPVLEIMEIFTS